MDRRAFVSGATFSLLAAPLAIDRRRWWNSPRPWAGQWRSCWG